ncbi:MAG: rane protein [Candidatus Aminicenantes bacterium]|jgi:hypothetical protein|nr:rane protein [Candidatus Aminicenantes bacterium]
MGLTLFIFNAIGLDAERALQEWVLPVGAMGAVIIGAWLVEHKQSVIENMAPLLTLSLSSAVACSPKLLPEFRRSGLLQHMPTSKSPLHKTLGKIASYIWHH